MSGFTCEKAFSLTVAQCAVPVPSTWGCPPNVTPKTYSPNDPTAPEFISSINRLYVDGAGGVIDVVDYTPAVPVLETTIPLGGGAGSNRIYMIHEPVSNIVVGVYWADIVTSQPTLFFIDPTTNTVLSEITLSGYSAGFHCNPLFARQTRDNHRVVLFMQSFLVTQRHQLLLIDPVTRTVLLTRDIPFVFGGDSYVLSRIAFNCDLNEIVMAYDPLGSPIEQLQRIDIDTLADVAVIPLPAAVTLVSGVDYDDATGHLITVEFEAGQFHIRIRNAITGAQLQTIATGETTQIGGPRYNFALNSFVAPCRALNVVKYYDTNVLSQLCSVTFVGLLDPIYAAVAQNGTVYVGDSGGGDNVWELLPNAPTSYWKLDDASFGNRLDQIGDADLTDSNTNVTAVAGLIGNAAKFTAGLVSFLETIPNVPAQYFFSTGWTFVGWVNMAILPTTTSSVFSALTTGPDLEIDLVGGGPGQMRFSYRPTNVGLFNNLFLPFTSVGSWHFLRCWFDPSDMKMKAQIDMGTISETAALAAPTAVASTYLAFGNQGDGEFSVDECAFFGFALSDSQAANIYNGGVGKTCCPFS